MDKIKEFLHKIRMKRNTKDNVIDTLKTENYFLVRQLAEVQASYIRILEDKNARGRRRNANKNTD